MKKEKIVSDIRIMRPVIFRDKKTSKNITLQRTETIKVDNIEISFSTPNNISLFINISKRELNIAKRIFGKLLKTTKKEININNDELSTLFNYLEHIQTCIICTYTAIEALANITIPEDYKYTKTNSRGIEEIYNKKSIERYTPTSEKYTKIIPDILKIQTPLEQSFWSKFKKLENIRNEIIHQKTSKEKDKDVDSSYLAPLLEKEIFEIIESGYHLITYICNADQSHVFFPLGFGPAQMKIHEVDDFSENFKLVKRANSK